MRITCWLVGLLVVTAIINGGGLCLAQSKVEFGPLTELQDEYGKPLPGHALNDCEELFGDTIDRGVTWNTNPNLSSIVGQTIRIRFVLRDADLFSLQFRDQ